MQPYTLSGSRSKFGLGFGTIATALNKPCFQAKLTRNLMMTMSFC